MIKNLLLTSLMLIIASPTYANDSAVEIAVGGLQLRKESNVSMEKERLFLSRDAVKVEYDFRNTSEKPVITEVSFPIPPYKCNPEDNKVNLKFDDFQAWVDGKKIRVQKEVRAFVGGLEVTKELRDAKITIEEFGWYYPHDATQGQSWKGKKYEILTLKPSVREKLVKIGALSFDPSDRTYSPEWEVRLNYHWTQTFPPKTIVNIKHKYKPSSGYDAVQIAAVPKAYKDACLTAATLSNLKKRVKSKMLTTPEINYHMTASWVSYILTTANTWQTPIKDFELTIEKPKDHELSFCWDGLVQNVGGNRFKAGNKDFVPKNELKVYFFKEM